ncbi:MAG: isoprenylcysteine carboxylmethyltransferase family protein [Chitinophagaceae bacterium]|nr:MAG: isoprenylcysteine carboxylmethyltransferase family protein [Chitinophagaceae bacterium]
MLLWIRGIFFTILVPGTVAGYVPYLFMRNRLPDMNTGLFHWAGLLIMIMGILIYGWTAISFLLRGKGTPAIWFTKAISFIIGEEPLKMVSSGLYKYSRNPMYLGVITTVAGQGIFFQYSILLWYAFSLFIIFTLVVIFIEEPHLEEKFGEEYKKYKNRTSRWL